MAFRSSPGSPRTILVRPNRLFPELTPVANQPAAPRVDPGQRRRSQREARTALRQVFTEPTAAQRAQLRRQKASTIPLLVEGHKTGFAEVGGARVGIGTTEGRISSKSLIGLARHEVGHLLGAGHFAGMATPSTSRTSGDVGTVQGLRAVARTENIPQGQKFSRAQTIAKREGRIPPRLETVGRKLRTKMRLETQGFQTPHLLKAATEGPASRRQEARTKMRKLGRRLRGRIDF